MIKGEVEFKNELVDDSYLKADGYPTYHLAVVVDDHLMEITHIIRGENGYINQNIFNCIKCLAGAPTSFTAFTQLDKSS